MTDDKLKALKRANQTLIRERDNAITQREYEKELKCKDWAEVHKLRHELKIITAERDKAQARLEEAVGLLHDVQWHKNSSFFEFKGEKDRRTSWQRMYRKIRTFLAKQASQ